MNKYIIPYVDFELLIINAFAVMGSPRSKEILESMARGDYAKAIKDLMNAYVSKNKQPYCQLLAAKKLLEAPDIEIEKKPLYEENNSKELLLIKCYLDLLPFINRDLELNKYETDTTLETLYIGGELEVVAYGLWNTILVHKLPYPTELLQACELMGFDMTTDPPHYPLFGKIEIDKSSEND